MPDPILVRCEGSGCPPNWFEGTGTGTGIGCCSMCGQLLSASATAIPEHVRADIVAQLERGDFDA